MKSFLGIWLEYVWMALGSVFCGALMCIFCFGVLPGVPDWMRWVSFAYFMFGVLWLIIESLVGWINERVVRPAFRER